MKEKLGCAIGLVFVAAIIGGMITGIAAGRREKDRKIQEEVILLFRAWGKETGNPKKLTLKEFKLLKCEYSTWYQEWTLK